MIGRIEIVGQRDDWQYSRLVKEIIGRIRIVEFYVQKGH